MSLIASRLASGAALPVARPLAAVRRAADPRQRATPAANWAGTDPALAGWHWHQGGRP